MRWFSKPNEDVFINSKASGTSLPVEESLDNNIILNSDVTIGSRAIAKNYLDALSRWRYPIAIILLAVFCVTALSLFSDDKEPITNNINPAQLIKLENTLTEPNSEAELRINFDTLVKGRRDSTNLFLIQNASGDNLFRVNGVNKQIEASGNLAVKGEIVSLGAILTGGSSLDTQELRINGVLVCDVTGCIPSPAAIGSLDFNSLNASNINSGTLADARLSGFVTMQGNQFNGPNQLIKLDGSGQLPPGLVNGSFAGLSADQSFTGVNTFSSASNSFTGSGAGLTNVNAVTLNGQLAGFYTNASNLSSGTVNDARLSANVTTRGNTFNGVNQLVLLDGSGNLPALNASALTNINATNISTGTVADARLSASVSLLGASIDSAEITNDTITNDDINTSAGIGWSKISKSGSSIADLATRSAGDLSSGTLDDARLSSNVVLLNANQTFSGNNTFQLASAAFAIQDAVTPLGINLFEITDDSGATVYFNIDATGAFVNGDEICTVAGNCAGVGGQIGGSGTAGTIALFTANSSIANSILTESSGTVTAAGNLNVTGQYRVNGSQISSASLSNDSDLAKLDADQIFSGDNTFSSAANSFTGNGSGLTSLNASNVSSGTLNDARLSSNVALLNAANTFTNTNLVQVDSVTAFQVQKADSTSIFSVDSLNSTVGVGSRLSFSDNNQSITFVGGSELGTNTGISNPADGQIDLVTNGYVVASFTSGLGLGADAGGHRLRTYGTALFDGVTNSAIAFQIQDASAASLFTADTTARSASGGNLLKVGNSTGTDANTTILVVDHTTADPTTNLSSLNGGLFYNSTNHKLSIIEDGTVKEVCNKTDALCGGNSTTLTQAYTAGTSSADQTLVLSATDGGGLILQDAATTVGNLFTIQNNALNVDYFNVTDAGISVAGTIASTGNINTSGGAIQTNSTTRIDNSGNLTNIVNLSMSGYVAMAGNTTANRPGSPTAGSLYYDTDTDQLLQYNGTKWVSDRSTATKIVAASNSSQAAKDAADYVADGTGDQVEINAALTAAAGGNVYLMEGTYVANATILVPNNTTLMGAGRGTLIELADLDATENLIENSDTATGTGVVIRDLRLDGRKDLNTAGTQHGIYLNGMGAGTGSSARQGAKSSGLWADNFTDNGVFLENSSNNTIINNTVQENNVGIYLENSPYNTISTNAAHGNSNQGIYLNNSPNTTITGNAVHGNSDGIGSDGSDNLTLTGNTAEGNTGRGISLNGSSRSTLNGNNAEGNGAEGIAIDSSSNNSLTGNIAQGNGSDGIFLYSSSDNTLTGNTVRGNTASGFLFVASNGNTLTSNAIYDSGGSATNNGIYLSASDFNAIQSNLITDTSCTISCSSINISNSTSDKNYLEGNRFSGSVANAASINDVGTGTIYVNQQTNSTTSTNSDVSDFRFRGSANSATAFQVQNSSGGSLLNIDSSLSNITLLGNNDGQTGPWTNQATNLLPAIRSGIIPLHANGYAYVIGGFSSGVVQTSVYYAKLNADGSTGAWTNQASNLLPAGRASAPTVFANGYIYLIGGYNSGAQSSVYYAKVNADGSTGAWMTSSNSLPAAREGATAVVSKGYVYVMGGSSSASVYYAKLNADGSTGAWVTSSNSLPGGRHFATSVVANDYVYVFGGANGVTGQTSVYYAKLNADGSTGAWTNQASNLLPAGRYYGGSVTVNGYAYVIGGSSDNSNAQTSVYYAKLNADGSTGAWTNQASNLLPTTRYYTGAILANSYIYLIGGADSSNTEQTTVLYTSTSRLKIGASIDLLGSAGGQNLSDPGSAGSITAGNIAAVGNLQVQGTGTFVQGISIGNGAQISGNVNQSFKEVSYLGGADASGSSGAGTFSSNFLSTTVSGNYTYVSKAGNATACSSAIGSANGCELQIYDISNPASPTYVGGADASGSTNSGTGNSGFNWVAISGKYAYITKAFSATACSATPGSAIGCELQIYDISNPASPTYVGGADASGSTNSGTGTNSDFSHINISGRYAIIAKSYDATACSATPGSAIGCELQIYDISNPASPTYVGGADASGSTNSGTTTLIPFNNVSVVGRYAYVAADANNTACSATPGSAVGCDFQIYDISNPASPTYVGGADASGSTNSGTGASNALSVRVSGRYAYLGLDGNTTACSATPGSAIGCELQVYNISNPASPTYVGGADASGSTNSGVNTNFPFIRSMTISGKSLYLAKPNDATACSATPGSAIGCELQVYNISNPASPTYVGGADASGSTNSGTTSSAFRAFAVSGRYMYVAKESDATACSATPGSAVGCELQVYDLSGLEAMSLTAGSLQAGSLQVQDSAVFNNQLNVAGALSVGQSLHVNGNIGSNGHVLFQNTTNSATAFQIQNSTGGSLVTIDSQYSNITLLGNNDGQTSAWTNQATNLIPTVRANHTSVVANGYVYVLGGFNGTSMQSTVYYAKLNADGSTGAWSTNANALPAIRGYHTSVVANGYVYVLGGFNGTSMQSTVYYAKLNADGSTGAWSTNANALPATRSSASSVVANGYVYVLGGYDGANQQSTVYYAKLNADGSTGAWSTNANALPAIRGYHTSVVANGYVYVLGGYDDISGKDTIFYAKLNADGSTGAWTDQVSNKIPNTGRYNATSAVINGYLYIMGGNNTGGGYNSTVYYAKLNADGSTGAWSTNANALPAIRTSASSVVANGYVYVLGGYDSSFSVNTVYYSSTSRLRVGGSLDLVGSTSLGNLSELGGGGSITAGNITAVGSLQVQGSATFSQNASVLGSFNVGGSALFKNDTNSTTAFQIQNATGTSLLTVDTTNSRITLGSHATAPTLLVLGIRTDAGDPSCTTGGIYYNSNSSQFRGCANNSWKEILAPTVYKGYTNLTIENTTTETSLFTQSISAGALGTNKTMRVRLLLNTYNNYGPDENGTLKIKFGGTTVESRLCYLNQGATAAEFPAYAEFFIRNENSTSSQRLTGLWSPGNGQTKATPLGGTASVDTTSAQTLEVTWTMSRAVGADVVYFKGYEVEIF